MSRKALLLVHTNAASPELEEEFNTWYEKVHIPQLLERIPGLVRATRYVASQDLPHRYVALYEIEADDPAAVVKAINTAAATGNLDFTPAMDAGAPPVMALYELIGDHGI